MEKSNAYESSSKQPEAIKWEHGLNMHGFNIVFYGSIFALICRQGWTISLPTYLITSAILISGRIADNLSTLTTVKTVEGIEQQRNINIDVKETNPLFPERPSKKQLFSKPKAAFDAACLIPGLIFPPIGIILGSIFFYAALHNYRLSQNLKKENNNNLRG